MTEEFAYLNSQAVVCFVSVRNYTSIHPTSMWDSVREDACVKTIASYYPE